MPKDPAVAVRIPPLILEFMDKFRTSSPLYKTRSDVVRYALFKLFEKGINARNEARRRRREARHA